VPLGRCIDARARVPDPSRSISSGQAGNGLSTDDAAVSRVVSDKTPSNHQSAKSHDRWQLHPEVLDELNRFRREPQHLQTLIPELTRGTPHDVLPVHVRRGM